MHGFKSTRGSFREFDFIFMVYLISGLALSAAPLILLYQQSVGRALRLTPYDLLTTFACFMLTTP